MGGDELLYRFRAENNGWVELMTGGIEKVEVVCDDSVAVVVVVVAVAATVIVVVGLVVVALDKTSAAYALGFGTSCMCCAGSCGGSTSNTRLHTLFMAIMSSLSKPSF